MPRFGSHRHVLIVDPGSRSSRVEEIDEADRRGMRLSQAIAASPHLRHTLMWNGQRAPVDENLQRELTDDDELYLLGPLAGG